MDYVVNLLQQTCLKHNLKLNNHVSKTCITILMDNVVNLLQQTCLKHVQKSLSSSIRLFKLRTKIHVSYRLTQITYHIGRSFTWSLPVLQACFTRNFVKTIFAQFPTIHCILWKIEKFTLTIKISRSKIFCQINSLVTFLVKALI